MELSGRIHLGTLLCCLVLISCVGKENGDVEKESFEGKQYTVNADRTSMLRNPLSGWVIYSGLGDLIPDFWDRYDNLPSSNGTVKVSDYATTLYVKGSWADFNPEEGVYIWQEGVDTKPAQNLRMLIKGAEERNLKLAFTLTVDSRDKHAFLTPQYVMDKPGIQGFRTMTGSMEVWSPYPDCPVFQHWYEVFIKEMAKEYNDPDRVMFISGLGMGKWGEYHSCRYSTGDDSPREAVFEWVTDLYVNAFDKVPVVTNYHRWVGTGKDWDGRNYDPNSERLLQSAIDKGFCMRHDAFGMKTYYSTWERNFISARRHQVPVLGEGGWVVGSHGDQIKSDGYETYKDVRMGEFEEARYACVNMMDLRYSSKIGNGEGETWSWFNDAFDLVERFIQEASYRLFPDKLYLPEKIRNGSSFMINHRWRNLGWGMAPTGIKAYKDKYKVAFALIDPRTSRPVRIWHDNEAEPHKWTNESPTLCSFSGEVDGVAPGRYIWGVGIVDTHNDDRIGIRLSAKGNFTVDGWLELSVVEVE